MAVLVAKKGGCLMRIPPEKLRKAISLLLAVCLLAAIAAPAYAKLNGKAYDLLSDIMYTYKKQGPSSYLEIQRLIGQLKETDPGLGYAWGQVMEIWNFVNTDLEVNYDRLPNGLPQDDSLCIVVLGYQLNPDGTMAEELIGRCTVALNCAKQYPNAYLAVTGGGTAFRKPEFTEADQMAAWLKENGVEENRSIVENLSQTTVQNAQFLEKILLEQYPQVKTLAIVTSDYHVPLGCLLFSEQFIFTSYTRGIDLISVAANAGYKAANPLPYNPENEAPDVWAMFDAFINEL